MKIFHGLRVFEYALWQKQKPGNTENIRKAFFVIYVPLSLALITETATFKLQW